MKNEGIIQGTDFTLTPIEECWIDDVSFVQLREISPLYRLLKLMKQFSDLTITATGRNLYSRGNYPSYDPETNAGDNSDLLRGVDFENVPIPRTYQLQLTARFYNANNAGIPVR
jgi:hypothetical protein